MNIRFFNVSYFKPCFHNIERTSKGGGDAAMRKRKLNYQIHDPNPAAVTADYLLKVLIDANKRKVETAMRDAAVKVADLEIEIQEERLA